MFATCTQVSPPIPSLCPSIIKTTDTVNNSSFFSDSSFNNIKINFNFSMIMADQVDSKNYNSKEKEKDKEREKEKDKDDDGKKRRFSSFINYNSSNSNKRANTAPIRILMIGRPQTGKSSIISMLLNRDVHPGLNGRGIYVNSNPTTRPAQQEGNNRLSTSSLSLLSSSLQPTPQNTPQSGRLSSRSAIASLSSPNSQFPFLSPSPIKQKELTISTDFCTSSQDNEDNKNNNDNIEEDGPTEMAISPPIRTPRIISQDDDGNSQTYNSNGRRIYHSDKYVITDIDGFNETSTVDSVGAVLSHRKWLEDTMQGYNIILMVIKAQEQTETDRKVFALYNALLHDLRDMIHIAVTGCDMNPRWVRENEIELKKMYGTSKVVGVSFPSTEGGLLECIFEQMRKDSLVVLEESKSATMNPRVPVRAVKGGSMGSGLKKPERTHTRTRTFSR